jgi:hypothetical protein
LGYPPEALTNHNQASLWPAYQHLARGLFRARRSLTLSLRRFKRTLASRLAVQS